MRQVIAVGFIVKRDSDKATLINVGSPHALASVTLKGYEKSRVIRDCPVSLENTERLMLP